MDKLYIKDTVQKVLNSQFKSFEKKRMQDYPDRITLSCPYCGDSQRNESKKRGNIWYNTLVYVCFNCNKKTSFDKFAKDYNVALDPEKKLEIIQHLNANLTYKEAEADLMETQLEGLLDLSDLTQIFNDGDHILTEFSKIRPGGFVHQYLLNRSIDESKQINIYQAKYWHNSQRWEWVMVLLNRRGDKVLGIQIRNLKEGKFRFFKIYNWEHLYKLINETTEVDIELGQLIIYNKLSAYFNILNINFTQEVTVFEGYLDSLFYPNSIGVVGVNTDMKFLESSGVELKYFYDNDDAGYRKAEEKIKSGFKVFLWKKLFEDIVIKKRVEDPFTLLHRISKVKDLNKLAQLVPNPYSKLQLDEYFSRDIFDLKWLPKPISRWVAKQKGV